MNATVTPVHSPPADIVAAARHALDQAHRYLDRCKLAANTVTAYRRQTSAYVAWLHTRAAEHSDAFADAVGAEAAVTAWRRHLLRAKKSSPATINQALAAVTLLYQRSPQLHIKVKRVRVPRPGEPDALSVADQGKVERASLRRGARDATMPFVPGPLLLLALLPLLLLFFTLRVVGYFVAVLIRILPTRKADFRVGVSRGRLVGAGFCYAGEHRRGINGAGLGSRGCGSAQQGCGGHQ
ncbi:hypothetical protein AB0I35_30750 [Nocardia sp. NPDC050378]|uniref:hypothetical protein n=1 Tax=Nocardia sp. NPDC050378 TaxID=3155400 RepID=UPI0033E9E824